MPQSRQGQRHAALPPEEPPPHLGRRVSPSQKASAAGSASGSGGSGGNSARSTGLVLTGSSRSLQGEGRQPGMGPPCRKEENSQGTQNRVAPAPLQQLLSHTLEGRAHPKQPLTPLSPPWRCYLDRSGLPGKTLCSGPRPHWLSATWKLQQKETASIFVAHKRGQKSLQENIPGAGF